MEEQLGYDASNKKSIIDYAKKLVGKRLREVCKGLNDVNYAGKGRFGQTLEKEYFKYNSNSVSGPDFPLAKLELKSSPFKQLKSNK